MLEPMKLLISEENYEIEQRDMLISPESAEDLLAYRKADLIFTIAPVKIALWFVFTLPRCQ